MGTGPMGTGPMGTGPIPERAPRSEGALMDCQTPGTSSAYPPGGQDERYEPFTTEQSLCMSQLLSLQNLQSEYRTDQGIPSVPGSQESLNRDFVPGMAEDQPRIVSPMILRCREIMNAPPQEGVPAPGQGRIPVMRSSSSATTVPVMPPRPETPSETYSLPPSRTSLSPSLPSVSPPEPTALPSAAAFRPQPPSPPETTILPSAARIMQQQAQQADMADRAYKAQLQSDIGAAPQDGGGALRSRPLAASMPSQQPPFAATLPPQQQPFAATLPPQSSEQTFQSSQSRQQTRLEPTTQAPHFASGSQQPFAATLPPEPPVATIPPQLGRLASRGEGQFEPPSGLSSARAQSEASIASIGSSGGGPSSSNMPVIVTLPAALLHTAKPAGAAPGQNKPALPKQQGELYIAQVPQLPPGNPGDPVHISPLLRTREDRMDLAPGRISGTGGSHSGSKD